MYSESIINNSLKESTWFVICILLPVDCGQILRADTLPGDRFYNIKKLQKLDQLLKFGLTDRKIDRLE
jgi:hypothetical protein